MKELLPIFFLSAFVVLWMGVSYLIAMIGGWQSLAELYAEGAEQFGGRRWRMQSGAMRWTVRYNGALSIGSDRRGLYLSVLFLFRMGHPPLLIPWDDIRIYEHRGLIFSTVNFEFKRSADVRLTVSKRLGEQVALEAGRGIASEAGSASFTG